MTGSLRAGALLTCASIGVPGQIGDDFAAFVREYPLDGLRRTPASLECAVLAAGEVCTINAMTSPKRR
jgi:hypothetical protein